MVIDITSSYCTYSFINADRPASALVVDLILNKCPHAVGSVAPPCVNSFVVCFRDSCYYLHTKIWQDVFSSFLSDELLKICDFHFQTLHRLNLIFFSNNAQDEIRTELCSESLPPSEGVLIF